MIRIREARREDATGIAHVHVASWRTTYRGIVPNEYLAQLSVEQRAQRWMEITSAGAESIYVAENEGDGGRGIVGFASGGAERDGATPAYDGELYAVYILQECQGQSIGQRLVCAIAERLAQASFGAMLVWVLAANPSRGFYERLGGQLVREKTIDIACTTLSEVAYGWPDIRVLLEKM